MFVYSAEGISAKAVESYIRECTDRGTFVHTLQIIKGSKPLIRFAAEPYDFDSPQHIYSLSKSFTSIACGICFDEGLLSPNTKLCELFRDKMPDDLTEALEKLTLHDLLSMQSGHESCVLDKMRWANDSLKTFFAQPMAHEPGTVFAYSTAATCVCAAAVENVTGMKLVDFLDEKLFSKLDIKKPLWTECRDGQTLGGTGLYLSSNDLTKFGMFLKNKGVYNGERIVSEEYITNATKRHSVDINNGSIDWTSGYGYQFWMNSRGGFRGDGAFGQLCIVLPEEDIVVTFLGEAANMADEMALIYKLLDNMYGKDNDSSVLLDLSKNLYKPKKNENGFNNEMVFSVADNPSEITDIRLFGENLLHFEMNTAYGKKEIVCGNGEYILNHVMLKCVTPTILHLDPDYGFVERLSIFATYEMDENGMITVILRHSNIPHTQKWFIDTKNATWNIYLHVGDIICKEFSLTKITI